LRTALYNYLLARRHGGQFILRIEDTDTSRFVPGATEDLLKVLAWAGLDYDEGPAKGGPYGPYIQTERAPLYQEHAHLLVEKGAAYPCWCPQTPAADTDKVPSVKDGWKSADGNNCSCRAQSEAPGTGPSLLEAMLAARAALPPRKFTVRMKMPRDGVTVVRDALRGDIRYAFMYTR
jgi:glutamyl/glutaminyl-tRNA synthetase